MARFGKKWKSKKGDRETVAQELLSGEIHQDLELSSNGIACLIGNFGNRPCSRKQINLFLCDRTEAKGVNLIPDSDRRAGLHDEA